MTNHPRIRFCNCNYAQVVPPEVKAAALKALCDAGMAFDAVADLCAMSAPHDPALKQLVEGRVAKIVAYYPRAEAAKIKATAAWAVQQR